MSRSIASSLIHGLNKIKRAEYARDRNVAIAEMEQHILAAVDLLNDKRSANYEYVTSVIKLLASVGRGQLFPGMKNYIKNTREFDAAIEQLRSIVGEVEEIAVKSGRR